MQSSTTKVKIVKKESGNFFSRDRKREKTANKQESRKARKEKRQMQEICFS